MFILINMSLISFLEQNHGNLHDAPRRLINRIVNVGDKVHSGYQKFEKGIEKAEHIPVVGEFVAAGKALVGSEIQAAAAFGDRAYEDVRNLLNFAGIIDHTDKVYSNVQPVSTKPF